MSIIWVRWLVNNSGLLRLSSRPDEVDRRGSREGAFSVAGCEDLVTRLLIHFYSY